MTMLPDNLDAMIDMPGVQADPTPQAFETAAPQQDGEILYPDPPQQPEAAPAPVTQPAPQQAAPQQNDWQQEVAAFARSQREALERQNQPAPPPAPAPWVDPADRPENQQRLDDLLQRLSYDEAARREYAALTRQMDGERNQRMLQEQFGQFQQQMTYQMQAPTVQSQAFQAARGEYGEHLREDVWNQVVQEIFAGNAAGVAQALGPQNPGAAQVRALVADAAMGRALRTGQITPPAQRPAPPAQVRSDARNPAPSRATQDQWTDSAYLNSVIERAYENPFQFVRKPGGQS